LILKKVLIIGGTTYDTIIYLKNLPQPEPQTIHFAESNETLGSTGAGKTLNLTKLNVPNTLHSIIGKDVYGEKIINRLGEAGVDFIYDLDPNGTERHVNLMSEKGERISIFLTQSSSDLTLNLDKIECYIRESDVIVLNIIGYTKQLIPLIKKYKKPVWTDLHDYTEGNPYHQDFIDIADYIFVSSDNLPNYRKVMQEWMSREKELVVCTHGKGGSTALTKAGEWIETPILEEFSFKDANGAGDSFFSGYLYGHLKGKSIEESLKLGTICGGLCISSPELSHESLSEKLLEEEFQKYYK
jgi:sugar/nucleoside kinase (ribokinase family)